MAKIRFFDLISFYFLIADSRRGIRFLIMKKKNQLILYFSHNFYVNGPDESIFPPIRSLESSINQMAQEIAVKYICDWKNVLSTVTLSKTTWKWNFSSSASSYWYPGAKSRLEISAVRIFVNRARFSIHMMCHQKITKNIKCSIFAAGYSPSDIVATLFLDLRAHFLSNFSVQITVKEILRQ